MKTAVVSYSLTGNNTRFAARLSEALGVKHIKIQTPRPVNYGTITLDLIFKRKPKIDLPAGALDSYDLILLVGPVWMGQVAFPLRRCLDQIGRSKAAYAFLSVSGGADGSIPPLKAELTKRTGKEPLFTLDQHIRELLPAEPAPTRDDTSNYHLTDADCALFAGRALEAIKANTPLAI